MWRAHPESWLSRSFMIERRGRPIGRVVFASWSDRGAIELDGRRLPIRGEGFWRRRYFLSEDGKTLLRAQPAGPFRTGFHLVHGDEEYSLHRSSFLGRSHDLTRRGRPLGTIRAIGFLQRVSHIDLDDELAPELALFSFWLVVLLRRHPVAVAS
jgi:hypothetical protein